MLRSCLACVGLLLLPLAGAAGQHSSAASVSTGGERFAGLAGVVADSINGGPLTGAVVRVADAGRETVADSLGHFRIDSIPPGTYRVTLHHPLLDTLALAPQSPPIEFEAGRITLMALATPSGPTMLDMTCPQAERRAGEAGVLGIVRDPDLGTPLTGAQVTLTWLEILVGKDVGLRRTRRTRTATVDSLGSYAICGLPAELQGLLQVTRDGASTASVPVAVNSVSRVALRSLTLGASEAVLDSAAPAAATAPAAAAPATAARPLRRGPATLRGRVVDSTGAPLEGARVEVLGTPAAANTTASGAFALTDLPTGTQVLVVRSVGFGMRELFVELTARAPRELAVTLQPVQLLPTLEAQVAQRLEQGLEKVGFTQRRRMGLGRFVTREEIDQRRPLWITDMLRTMPGIQVAMDANGNQVLESTRAALGSMGRCVSVVVDNMPLDSLAAADLDRFVRAEEVAGIEVYSTSTVPGEFMTPGRGCGAVVVIWTRFRVGER